MSTSTEVRPVTGSVKHLDCDYSALEGHSDLIGLRMFNVALETAWPSLSEHLEQPCHVVMESILPEGHEIPILCFGLTIPGADVSSKVAAPIDHTTTLEDIRGVLMMELVNRGVGCLMSSAQARGPVDMPREVQS